MTKFIYVESSIYILPIIGIIGTDFKYTDVLMHLNAAKDSQYIKLVIDSPGGNINEGEKIKKALQDSGKVMFATNSGDVASYAVSLFEIAPASGRVYDPAKGVFMIHMPFIDPKDGVGGTASDLEIIAKELKRLQNNIISEYEKSTGATSEVLAGFMNENKPLTPEQVETLGFATVRKADAEPQFKAVAFFNNNNDMTNEETKKQFGVIETLLNKMVAFFAPKNLMVQDTTGKELDFGPDIQAPEQIVIGVKATVDGAPADGEYVFESGQVYKFVAGELMEIIMPEAVKPDPEKEKLKTDLADAQKQLAEAQNKLTQVDSEMTKFKAEFAKFKSEFSTGDAGPNTTGGTEEKRKAFKTKN